MSLAETTVVAAKVNGNIEVVREAVEHSPGMNSTQLRKALSSAGMTSGGDRSTAMREAREQGLIVRVKSGREHVFYPPSAAEVMWMERADGEESDDVDQVA